MAKPKFKKSFFFVDSESNNRFLFKIINFGKKDKDELKFIFKHPNDNGFGVYKKPGTIFEKKPYFGNYSEITYHSDGSLLCKVPKFEDSGKPKIYNPIEEGTRRKKLRHFTEWEAIIKMNIIRYQDCHTELTKDAQCIEDKKIFSGEPFECIIYFGSSQNKNLNNISGDVLFYRENKVGDDLDILLKISASDYRGEYSKMGRMTITNDTNKVSVSKSSIYL